MTLTFVADPDGVYAAHSYKFDRSTSTFIVECSEATWMRAGYERMSAAGVCTHLERVFREPLAGAPLLTNNFVKWLNFPLVRNARWRSGHVVLLGDALHTAHFSIGSGTKLALEDAIALARAFAAEPSVAAALERFERERRPRVEELQRAAAESRQWFEEMERHMHLAPLPFAVEAMTRSGKIDLESLRRRDPDFVAAVERWRNSSRQPPAD